MKKGVLILILLTVIIILVIGYIILSKRDETGIFRNQEPVNLAELPKEEAKQTLSVINNDVTYYDFTGAMRMFYKNLTGNLETNITAELSGYTDRKKQEAYSKNEFEQNSYTGTPGTGFEPTFTKTRLEHTFKSGTLYEEIYNYKSGETITSEPKQGSFEQMDISKSMIKLINNDYELIEDSSYYTIKVSSGLEELSSDYDFTIIPDKSELVISIDKQTTLIEKIEIRLELKGEEERYLIQELEYDFTY